MTSSIWTFVHDAPLTISNNISLRFSSNFLKDFLSNSESITSELVVNFDMFLR